MRIKNILFLAVTTFCFIIGCTKERDKKSVGVKLSDMIVASDLNAIKEYIADGHDLNQSDYDGFYPLNIAVLHKNKPVIKLLLQHGADPNVKGVNEVTPWESIEQSHIIKFCFESSVESIVYNLLGDGRQGIVLNKILDSDVKKNIFRRFNDLNGY